MMASVVGTAVRRQLPLARPLISAGWRSGLRAAAIIFGAALALRLVFALITASTFDADEFVILGLSRAVAHGAMPYRELVFFHPPGALIVFAALQHFVTWWPAARVLTLAVDSVTAVLVWWIARQVLDRNQALIAGLIYAASPIALISAVRVGPDPIVTALAMLGIAVLISSRSRSAAIGAGLCLALAVWTKYTAVLYVPVYLLISPRRFPLVAGGWLAGAACLFAPFFRELPALVNQTVVWQLQHRPQMHLDHKLLRVALYWLALNPLAVIGLWRFRGPRWVTLGFVLGASFTITAEAYYHYFAVVVPFAAILGAPVVAPLARRSRWLLPAAALAATCLWAMDVSFGSGRDRMWVSASRLAQSEQAAGVLEHVTPPNAAVLSDQPQYALLANRQPALNYFWNMNALVSARTLEGRLPELAAVVQTKNGVSYPAGFIDYLARRHFRSIDTTRAVVWVTSRPGAPVDIDGTRPG
ncbi:MAG TPA: glycosyltransferase family 39 protein [Chloroflexota bacterium]|nr:glycosyltransferase family 39 protein [Chloroflexota bacterium]